MADKAENMRSDVPAKLAYVRHLIEVEGFDDARITKKPADITARRGNQLYYFEIKYTTQGVTYFGAATLTEWEVALACEERYRFVIAFRTNDSWSFRSYTPQEFMMFSYIPPFQGVL